MTTPQSAVSANNLAVHHLARATATRPRFDRTILTLSMRMRSMKYSSVARPLASNSLIRPLRASFKQHVSLPFRGDGGCIRIAANDSAVESCECAGLLPAASVPTLCVLDWASPVSSYFKLFACEFFPLRRALLQQRLGRLLLAVLLSVHSLAHVSLLHSEEKSRSEFNFAGPAPCLFGTMVKRRRLILGIFKRCTSR